MKPDISEFSYGFALTAEWIESVPPLQLAGAPEFPSLYAEGQAGGGYDVHIPGIAVFLQFKLSEVLERSNAKESELVGLPYFRMRLRALRHSDQHRLLLGLESPDHLVYYAAPEFSTPQRLNAAYLDKTTMRQTALFRPAEIGQLPDDKEHYVVFTNRSLEAYLCSSEPQRVHRAQTKDILEAIGSQLKQRTLGNATELADVNREFYSHLVEHMRDVYGEFAEKVGIRESDYLREPPAKRSLAAHAQYLSQTLFGCSLLVG